jgi:hypothetical protein
MKLTLAFLLALLLAVQPLAAQKKDEKKDKKEKDKIEKDIGDKPSESDDKRPSGRQIREEAGQVTFDKSREIHKKQGQGDVIRFTPVKIGGLRMRDFARGTVIGLLDIDRKGEATGLPPGKYHVYIKLIRGDWSTFYEKDGNIVKDAVGVHYHEEGRKEPVFREGLECIVYSHWEFCY